MNWEMRLSSGSSVWKRAKLTPLGFEGVLFDLGIPTGLT